MSVWETLEAHWTMSNDTIKGDVDMVIGMGVDVAPGGQRPSPQSVAVARKAFELVRMTHAPRLLFTGGYAKGGPCESRLMGTFIRQTFELTDNHLEILAETKSWNTGQNVLYSLPILQRFGCRNVIVVAQQWHARRVRATWRRLTAGTGIRVTVVRAESPYGGGTQFRLKHFLIFLAWDSLAWLVSKIKGYV